MTALATIIRIAKDVGVSITDEQRIEIEKRVAFELGGDRYYFGKRAARPAGNLVTAARASGLRPAAAVREVMQTFGVSRRTAYRWIGKR